VHAQLGFGVNAVAQVEQLLPGPLDAVPCSGLGVRCHLLPPHLATLLSGFYGNGSCT
jgi:hypothetical protein